MSFRIERYVAGVEAPHLFLPPSILRKHLPKQKASPEMVDSAHSFSCCTRGTDSSAAPPLTPPVLAPTPGRPPGVLLAVMELRWPSYPSGANAQSQYDCRLSVYVHGTLRGSIASLQQPHNLMESIKSDVSENREKVSVLFRMFAVGQQLYDTVTCHHVRVSYLLSELNEETSKTQKNFALG